MKTALLLCSLLLMTIAQLPAAEARELTPLHQWKGSVETGKSDGATPQVITSAAEMAAVWKKCERTDALPEIDWSKQFALLATTAGSVLRLGARLEAGGDVKALGLATMDFRPGFRYVLLVLPRDGVKTVNGQPLAAP